MSGTALLVLGLVALVPFLVLVMLWAADQVRRQVLLYQMQKMAAWNWAMARKYPASAEREHCGVGGYRPQAEHLDRHIRAAREGWGDDADARERGVAGGVDPHRGAVGGRGARADRPGDRGEGASGDAVRAVPPAG